jgi:hypothetical protein
MLQIESKMVRAHIMKAIQGLVTSSVAAPHTQIMSEKSSEPNISGISLPPGKEYHYFGYLLPL